MKSILILLLITIAPVVIQAQIAKSILNRAKDKVNQRIDKKTDATRTVLWSSLKNRTKIAFGGFNDFIGTYPWGQKKGASLIDASYTEPQVANAVNSIYNEMIKLTRESESLTKKHKGQQVQYELMTK